MDPEALEDLFAKLAVHALCQGFLPGRVAGTGRSARRKRPGRGSLRRSSPACGSATATGRPPRRSRLAPRARAARICGHLQQLSLALLVRFLVGQLWHKLAVFGGQVARQGGGGQHRPQLGAFRAFLLAAEGRCSAFPGRRGCPSSRAGSPHRNRGPGARWWPRRCRSRGCGTTAWPPGSRWAVDQRIALFGFALVQAGRRSGR